MPGSIGGRWGGDVHGVTEHVHRSGKPGGLSPSDLQAALNQRPTSQSHFGKKVAHPWPTKLYSGCRGG